MQKVPKAQGDYWTAFESSKSTKLASRLNLFLADSRMAFTFFSVYGHWNERITNKPFSNFVRDFFKYINCGFADFLLNLWTKN